VPFVYLPLGEFPRGARFYRYLHQYLQADDLICFSSTADRAVYERLVASSPAQVCVLPFGIDPAPYRQASLLRSITRRENGVAEEDPVFVVHGRFDPEKNVHAATALFGQLARHNRRCRLWLVSPSPADSPSPPGPRPLPAMPCGSYREVLIESLRGADAGLVWWWGGGSRDRLARIVAAADIGLNLTLNRDENFGFSTVEAMAAGLPVIGTDWGGLKDTIEDAVTGYRIPTVITSAGVAIDHYAAMRRAIHLIDDATARRRMGTAAVARVHERYLIEHCTDALLHQVRSLVGRTAVSRPHRWTPLGERLVQRYSTQAGAGPGPLPARMQPPEGPEDTAIVRQILRPYGTCDQDNEPDPRAVFMLASVLLRTNLARVTSGDPIYPVTLDLEHPAEAALYAVLEARGYVTYEHLITLAQAGPGEAAAALGRLLAAGVVVQSRDGAEMRLNTGDEDYVGSWNSR
jgi:glycosyltransferase involved in cell wall biosynthesis